MGGRGAKSGVKKSASYFSKVNVEGTPGSYTKQAQEVLRGVHDVLSDFGLEDSLAGVRYSDETGKTGRGKNAVAGVNGFNQLTISNSYLKEGDTPEDLKQSAAATFHGTGAHEAGHIVVNEILRKNVMPDGSLLQQSTARKNGKLEKAVIKEATKRFGSNPTISKYGSTSFSEKVAEAVSDVYSNKGGANPYSNVIVQVLKDTQSGTFKPKINYNSGIKY